MNLSRQPGQMPWVTSGEMPAGPGVTSSPGRVIPHQAHTRIQTDEDPESAGMVASPFWKGLPGAETARARDQKATRGGYLRSQAKRNRTTCGQCIFLCAQSRFLCGFPVESVWIARMAWEEFDPDDGSGFRLFVWRRSRSHSCHRSVSLADRVVTLAGPSGWSGRFLTPVKEYGPRDSASRGPYSYGRDGGRRRFRTSDPLLVRQVLSP